MPKNSISFLLKNKEVLSPPKAIVPPRPFSKKRILVWSDACVASTGFGIVSKHIMKALYSTGRYDLDQLAINYFGDFYNKEEFPYTLVPARLKDPKDPYGKDMLIQSLEKGAYDYLLVINDSYVTNDVTERVLEARKKNIQKGKPWFKIIYYYPVDCRLWDQTSALIRAADKTIVYNHYGKIRTNIDLGLEPHNIIYHGCDVDNFFPIEDEEVARFRSSVLKVEDPETFLWINVNRNSPRKDMARNILAFSEFKKKVPNSRLYLHTRIVDGPGPGTYVNLKTPCQDLGLEPIKDVIFPQDFDPANALPIKTLNMLFNCANASMTTTLGEGWGMGATDSITAGIPFLAPSNSSFPEIIGLNEERGYLYPCKEKTYVDGQGFRPVGYTTDIVEHMLRVYEDHKASRTREKIYNGLRWAQDNSWKNIGLQWIDLFKELDEEGPVISRTIGAEEL